MRLGVWTSRCVGAGLATGSAAAVTRVPALAARERGRRRWCGPVRCAPHEGTSSRDTEPAGSESTPPRAGGSDVALPDGSPYRCQCGNARAVRRAAPKGEDQPVAIAAPAAETLRTLLSADRDPAVEVCWRAEYRSLIPALFTLVSS